MPEHRCIVPGCKSGYDSCVNKHHFFTAPKDPAKLEQWKKATEERICISKGVPCHCFPAGIETQPLVHGVLILGSRYRNCLSSNGNTLYIETQETVEMQPPVHGVLILYSRFRCITSAVRAYQRVYLVVAAAMVWDYQDRVPCRCRRVDIETQPPVHGVLILYSRFRCITSAVRAYQRVYLVVAAAMVWDYQDRVPCRCRRVDIETQPPVHDALILYSRFRCKTSAVRAYQRMYLVVAAPLA
ncbi:hypothetical protein QTP88_024719 [Uroleucon formosanum]